MAAPITVRGAMVWLGGVASESGVARVRRGSRSLEHREGRQCFW